MNGELSSIVAGTMLWGQWGRKMGKNDMSNLIHHCVDNDITTFDHADIYGGYTNEADFGLAFIESNIKRDEIQLISKCGIKMVCDNRNYRVGHYDYNKNYIIQSCEQSLKNLKTDYLDVFLMHRPSPLMHGEEIAAAATLLKQQGKILSFGLSNFTPSQTELVRRFYPVDYNQIEFSLTHHHPLTDGSLDHMILNKIRPMAWAPLGSVFKEDNMQTQRIKTYLSGLADKYSVPQHVILLRWILDHPSGIVPVVGTGDKSRIGELHLTRSLEIDPEDWFELWTVSMGHPVP